jgi:hypothetical protein
MIRRSAKDRNGKEVVAGDVVRVIGLEPKVIKSLPEAERSDVASMIGQTFEVEEIDEYGSAWVCKWWGRGDGKSESHNLALSPAEMELVETKSAS